MHPPPRARHQESIQLEPLHPRFSTKTTVDTSELWQNSLHFGSIHTSLSHALSPSFRGDMFLEPSFIRSLGEFMTLRIWLLRFRPSIQPIQWILHAPPPPVWNPRWPVWSAFKKLNSVTGHCIRSDTWILHRLQCA